MRSRYNRWEYLLFFERAQFYLDCFLPFDPVGALDALCHGLRFWIRLKITCNFRGEINVDNCSYSIKWFSRINIIGGNFITLCDFSIFPKVLESRFSDVLALIFMYTIMLSIWCIHWTSILFGFSISNWCHTIVIKGTQRHYPSWWILLDCPDNVLLIW
jgi:hypothetical protein